MTVVRELAAAVVLACVALGFASPARAEQVMEGVFTYMQEGQPPATWTIYPICVPTVGDLREPLYLPVACTLHVTGSAGMGGGDARLTGRPLDLHKVQERGHAVPGWQHGADHGDLRIR